MNEGQLPTFDKDKVYALTGETWNLLKSAIIKQIALETGMSVEDRGPNKVKLKFDQWRTVKDCAGVKFEVPVRNVKEPTP